MQMSFFIFFSSLRMKAVLSCEERFPTPEIIGKERKDGFLPFSNSDEFAEKSFS